MNGDSEIINYILDNIKGSEMYLPTIMGENSRFANFIIRGKDIKIELYGSGDDNYGVSQICLEMKSGLTTKMHIDKRSPSHALWVKLWKTASKMIEQEVHKLRNRKSNDFLNELTSNN